MNSFILKLIACFSMILDHSGYVIFGKLSFLNYLGRFAFPIFAFQISQGYIHTKDFKKYLFKLIVFAIISQVPFMLFTSLFTNDVTLNIFFTLLLGLVGIFCYDKSKNKIIGIIPGLFLAFFANYIKTDYGFYGVAIIMLFYIFKDNKINTFLSFLIATMMQYLFYIFTLGYSHYIILLMISTILPIFLILLYNGKKGRSIKYFLYFFYPVHLVILYLIYILLL